MFDNTPVERVWASFEDRIWASKDALTFRGTQLVHVGSVLDVSESDIGMPDILRNTRDKARTCDECVLTRTNAKNNISPLNPQQWCNFGVRGGE